MSSQPETIPFLPDLYGKLAVRLASPDENYCTTLLEDIRDVLFHYSLDEQHYIIEAEIADITDSLVTAILKNRAHTDLINDIDCSIGLLVRNARCSLTLDAMAMTKANLRLYLKHEKKMRDKLGKKDTESKYCFNFDDRKLYHNSWSKLKCYSQLFYALQTQPRYLSRLLFAVPTFQISTFFKNCVYSLFFCESGNHERDGYHLCRILQAALKEEIKHKITKANHFIDNDPMIITLALDCYRAHRQDLFDILQPVILDIVSLKEPSLCLDPVSLYKDHYNLNGNYSFEDKPPQEITIEQALSDNYTRSQLAHNIPLIVQTCGRLIDAFISPEFIDLIPFGLKCLCKTLHSSLSEKLASLNEPYGEEDEIKIILNVILTRWIRPCILFPEGYLTNLKEHERRTSLISRRNLNGVYKVLHAVVLGKQTFTFSPSGTQSTADVEETAQLDSFIGQSWSQLKCFVDSILSVDDITEIFFFSEFTDDANLKPPTVKITFREIMECHSILHKFKKEIAPSKSDPIDVEFHQLMEECGSPPEEVQSLFKANYTYMDNIPSDELLNIEISLPLEAREIKNDLNVSKSTIMVKQAIVELIKIRTGYNDLNQILFQRVSWDEVNRFVTLSSNRKWHLPKHLTEKAVLCSPIASTLPKLLEFTIRNIRQTEALSFDELITMIGKDIINILRYRAARYAKMIHLQETYNSVQLKHKQLDEIYDFYSKYLKKCIASYRLSPTIGRFGRTRVSYVNGEYKIALFYSAWTLKRKGALYRVGKIPKGSSMKSLQFEISMLPDSHLGFEIRVVDYDDELHKVNINLEYLLKLQFDGYKTINFLGCFQLSIAYLIYFLNSRFYLRKK